MEDALQSAESVSLTFDWWILQATESYLIIIAHLIHIKWEMHSSGLQAIMKHEIYTGACVEENSLKAADEWELTEKEQ